MTVLKMIEELKELPPNAEVYVWDSETNTACPASLEEYNNGKILITSPEMC